MFPHLTRHYDLDLHLADWQIGLLMAVPSLCALFFQPIWGYIADRVLTRTLTFRIAMICSTVMVCFFVFAYQIGGFLLLLPVTICFMICYYAGVPINSAIILSFLGKKRRHLFGKIRVSGSVSFTIGIFFISPLMVELSRVLGMYDRGMVFMTAGLMYLLAFFSTRWDENHFEKHHKPEFQSFSNLLKNLNLMCLYACIYITSIGASAGIQYIGPYIGHRGLSERFFSTFWLVGVCVEIGLTFYLEHIVRRVGLKTVIVGAFLAESLRWIGISQFDPPAMILIFNVFHGFAVIGMFFASAMYLDAECEESIRSTAQALLYFSFVSGQVTGYLLSSFVVSLYDHLPRAEAIQTCFFWFGAFNVLSISIGGLFLKRESSEPQLVEST